MKEFLYVGHYIDTDGNYVLKVGTTNDLERRRKEHTRNYHKPTATNRMRETDEFVYDFSLALSKYNTLRYEERTKNIWCDHNFGQYVRNDRFVFKTKPPRAIIKIRKEYIITL